MDDIIERRGVCMEKLKNLSKRKKIVLCAAIVLIAIYFIGVYFYSSHFLNGTTINGVDCSNKTVDAIESKIEKNIKSYELKITERKELKDSVKGSDIELTYLDNDVIGKYQESQNPFSWPLHIIENKTEKQLETASYDAKKLTKIFKDFQCFKKKNITMPVSAYPKYAGDNKYKIQKEVEGNKVLKEKLKTAVINCIMGGDESLDIEDAGCYMEPKYRKDDKEIKQLKEEMEKLVKGTLTWDYSNRYINPVAFKDGLKDNKFIVNGDITNQFIKIKNHTKAVIDSDAIEDWLIDYATDTNTIYNGRRFKNHSGKLMNVPSGGPYGWRMNIEKEEKAIKNMMKNGTDKTREPYYIQKGVEGTNGQINDIGDSYAEVDLTNQTVYIYKDGKQIFSTSCVSGNTSLGRGTHTGVGVVQYKQKDKVLGGPGYDYESPVRYWMPFNGGEGFHDADWRNSFGGTIYKTNGSHGCINLPIYAAATIYNIIDAGWPVVVYY